MKNYLVICEDSSNLSPVYSLFTTKEKAQEFFEKEMEDYWPREDWNGDSYDIDGKTAAECIDQLYYSDTEGNFMYAIELDADSGKWED